MNQQQQKHQSRSHKGLKLILLSNIRPRFCCYQTRKHAKLAWRLPYLSNVSPRTNDQIYKHNISKQRKWLSTHWQSDLKKNPSWATVGPAKDKHQALTHRWKCFAIVVIKSGVWSSVNVVHFLLQMTFLLLFSMTNEIKITSLKARLELKFSILRLSILTLSNK